MPQYKEKRVRMKDKRREVEKKLRRCTSYKAACKESGGMLPGPRN